jgi:6-phosphofructokinase 2
VSGAGGRPAIVTLTLNPAIDASTRAEHVISDRKLRCAQPVYEPGGGGINVSRVLRRLGEEAPAIYPAGGPAGALLTRLLEAEGVCAWPVPIDGWTRENLNVREEASGRQYRFCMPGPALTDGDLARCLALLEGIRPAPAWVVSSGSLPPGVAPDVLARLARLVRDAGSRLVLDSSGEPLRLAVAEGVEVLKPSLAEFEELTGAAGADERRLQEIACDLVARGLCGVLVLSLGSRGAIWVTSKDSGRVVAPAVPVESVVGAGDSLVAGLVLGLRRGRGVGDAVRYGVAAASSSVMHPGTGLCRPEEVDRLYAGMGE